MKQLRNKLNVTNKLLEEKQFNFNIIFKKSRAMEEELSEKRNRLRKITIQHNIQVSKTLNGGSWKTDCNSFLQSSELEVLRKRFQEIETEKNELSRKLETYESRDRYNTMHHDDLLKRNNELKSLISVINE